MFVLPSSFALSSFLGRGTHLIFRIVIGSTFLWMTMGYGIAQTVTKKPTGQISQTITDWSDIPTAASIGEFGSGTQSLENLISAVTLAGITFTTAVPANVTINTANGSFLTLGSSGITLAATGKNVTMNHDVFLAANQTWSVGTNTQILELNGVLSDGGNGFGLTKSGAGRIILSGSNSNTFSGLTTITGGVLYLNKSNGATAIAGNITASGNPANIELGASDQIADTSIITLNNGAKLQLNGFNETVGGIQTSASGTSLVQATESGSNQISTLTINNSANHVFDGILRNSSSGTGNVLSIVKTGLGNLTLSHSGTNANGLNFSGTTTVEQGVLELRATGNGKTLTTWQSAVTVNAGASLLLSHTNAVTSAETLNRIISGAGNLIKRGNGQVNLTGVNTYTGVTTLEAGILNVATLADYGQSSSLGNRPVGSDSGSNVSLLFRGGTLQYTGSTAQSTNRAIRISITGGAFIDASGSTLEATLSFTAASSPDLYESGGARQLTLTGTNTGNNLFATRLTDQHVTTGKTSVNKTGPGTWILAPGTGSPNTYTGLTTIYEGVLALQGGVAIVDSGIVSLANVAGATLRINTNETIGALEGGGSLGGEVQLLAQNLTIGGGDVSGSFAGIITSNGTNKLRSLVKIGTGTQYLTGTNSTYAGFTELNAGILNIASITNLGQPSSIGQRMTEAANGDVGIIFRGGTLQYTGATAQSTNRAIRISTVGGAFIDASGSTPEASLNFTAATSPDLYETGGARQITFTGTNIGNNSFNIRLTDQAAVTGKTTVNKTGLGTWRLTGTHAYTGDTNIQEGTLLVNATLGATPTIVSSGATLGGIGTLGGTLTIHGRLSPGGDALLSNNGIGVLKAGNTTFSATSQGSIFGVAANGYNASVMNPDGTINAAYVALKTNRSANGNDRLEVTGHLDFSSVDGVTMDVVWENGYQPQYGHAFDILDWTTLNSDLSLFNYGTTGRVGGAAESGLYDLHLPALTGTPFFYNLDYFASHGVIVIVPEPNRSVLLLVGALLMLGYRKRKVG